MEASKAGTSTVAATGVQPARLKSPVGERGVRECADIVESECPNEPDAGPVARGTRSVFNLKLQLSAAEIGGRKGDILEGQRICRSAR